MGGGWTSLRPHGSPGRDRSRSLFPGRVGGGGMKKDIVALIIFLTTAVLVFLVHGQASPGSMASSETVGSAEKAVLVSENPPRPVQDVPSTDQRIRDS